MPAKYHRRTPVYKAKQHRCTMYITACSVYIICMYVLAILAQAHMRCTMYIAVRMVYNISMYVLAILAQAGFHSVYEMYHVCS